MVMLVRCEGEEDEDEDGDVEGSERLLKGLTHQCSLTLHVQGLPTGFCRDIHGQVSERACGKFVKSNEHLAFSFLVYGYIYLVSSFHMDCRSWLYSVSNC